MCGRHAWGALGVEAAFRHGFLHGPAALYQDLMERAVRAFRLWGALQSQQLARRLRATGSCMMCEMGLGADSHGAARAELLQQGRDPGELLSFAEATRRYWWRSVCGRCFDDGSLLRCRPHLLEDLSRAGVEDLARHRVLVKDLLEHFTVYRQSFVWGYHGTETDGDRAALISAVGWCSGWQPWIPFVGRTPGIRPSGDGKIHRELARSVRRPALASGSGYVLIVTTGIAFRLPPPAYPTTSVLGAIVVFLGAAPVVRNLNCCERIVAMTLSLERVQQWVKAWVVGVDPEVDVQVLRPHDDPGENGEIIPVRLGRHGYRMTVGFPERSFPGSPLPDETRQTLEQVVRLLQYMEARGLHRSGQDN